MVVHNNYIESRCPTKARGSSIMPEQEPAPRVSVTVPTTPAEAFRVYTERQLEWQPPAHLSVTDAVAITMEPKAGGRYYERGADGTEVVQGTVTEWAPPSRVAVTWRIGPGWRLAPDDENASVIVVEFSPAGPDSTEVAFTYTQLERHGEMAPMLRAAIANPGPDGAVQRYAETVRRHATAG
jgi:uncharacterized protein YndB with AHSA1/START domain